MVYTNKTKGFFKVSGVVSESYYTDEFWKEFINHPFYKPFSPEILKEMNSNLHELNNIRK